MGRVALAMSRGCQLQGSFQIPQSEGWDVQFAYVWQVLREFKGGDRLHGPSPRGDLF